MVKLIRIIADKTISNTVIENTFNPAFDIEPNSRIALQSVNANLLRTSNDTFTITTFNNTLSVDGHDVTLTPDTYDSGPFVTNMITNITLQGGSTASPGLNLNVVVNNDAISFEKFACPLRPARWNDWALIEGQPDLTTDGTFDADGSADDIDLLAEYIYPNSSYTFSGQVTTVGSVRFGIADVGTFVVGIEIQAGSNEYILYRPDGIPVNTGVVAVNGDIVSIARTRENIVYTCGAYTNTYTMTFNNQEYFNSIADDVAVQISANAGSNAVIANFSFTLLDDAAKAVTKLKTIRTTLTMGFGSESLAKYCGFSTVAPAAQSGDPAIVSAGGPLKGDPVAPGILVCIDPMILESYDGDQRNTTLVGGGNRRTGRNNILYVLQSTNPDLVQQETFPIPLNIRNRETMQINQLRITFKDQTNGKILAFNGEPSVVLVIYGPGE